MKKTIETIDEKGRLVRLIKKPDGATEVYYMGRDCEGIIRYEDGKEYVDVDGQKRYWGGIIDQLPDDQRIQLLNEFTVFVIKPDGVQLAMEKSIKFLIEKSGGTVVAECDFIYTDISIRKMYPHFFAKEWQRELFDYLMSGSSHCFLVEGRYVHHKIFALRNEIRSLFCNDKEPKIKSLVHCAQRQSDAIRQALLFFTLEKIVVSVGLKHG